MITKTSRTLLVWIFADSGIGRRGRLGLLLCSIMILLACVGPLLYSVSPTAGALSQRLLPPLSSGHLLGTDALGRDVLARVLAGARWSLGIAVVACAIAMALGTLIGILAATARPWVASAFRQAIDFGIAAPGLVLAVAVLAVVGNGFFPLAMTLGVLVWPLFSRVAYAESLSLKTRDFTLAAKMMGVSAPKVIAWHIWPGVRPTITVISSFSFATILLTEAGLAFIGLGAPLTQATWGNMLADSNRYLASAPWLMGAPAVCIVITVLGANLLGDGLAGRSGRDAGLHA